MDDSYVRYGFLTIYERTWFLKRINNNHFLLSPLISAKAQSSSSDISLRECFLATALRAANFENSRYSKRSDHELIISAASEVIASMLIFSGRHVVGFAPAYISKSLALR